MAVEVANADFVTFPGDTVRPTFTVVDADGNPVDISGATAIEWLVRVDQTSAALATLTLAGGAIALVAGGVGGQFIVTIPAATTSLLSNGAYQHVARLTFPAPVNIVTAIVGRLMVDPNVNWSYNAALVGSVPLYQVRRALGDVIPDDKQMFDTELLAFLSARAGNVLLAAADAARALAAQYARKVDTNTPGGISTQYGDQMRRYLELAETLAGQSKQSGRFVTGFAGGISVSQKVNTQLDVDRVQPSFNIGMQDNILVPVPQVGNETPTIPMAGAGGPGSAGA